MPIRFRWAKRESVNEGNFRKTLVYAIGEVLLIVIGVLTALQVNNWNENRKSRNEETVVLRNLRTDFQNSIREFEYLNSFRDRIISSSEEMLELSHALRLSLGPSNMGYRVFVNRWPDSLQ